MNLAAQIGFYLQTAIKINEDVGGTRAYQAKANNKDRFIVIRDNVNQNFHYIKTKLEERQRKKGTDLTIIDNDIREKIEEIYRQLERMRDAVNSQKSSEGAQKLKYDLIDKFTQQTHELKELLDNSEQLFEKKHHNRDMKGQTLTEMKAQLLDPDKVKQTNRFNSNKKQSKNEPAEIEMQAMQKWKKEEELIDEEIENVIESVQRWKNGVLLTGQLIDETDKQIQAVTENVDSVNEDLFNSNKKLKDIVEKFRKPHKFCLDVVLVLVLIALIVAIIKLSA